MFNLYLLGLLEVIDEYVYLGPDKIPCRLIIYRAPDSVVNERIRKAAANYKKKNKGKTLSKSQRNWLKFSLFVTNVTREMWSPEVVGTIYRLRWQIELIFKSWKSLCHINILRGTRHERIECYVYGRLIAIVVLTILYAFTCGYVSQFQQEVSLHKLIDWLIRRDRLSKAVLSLDFDTLLRELMSDSLKMLCKQRRKRMTTHQLLANQVPYLESFINENNKLAA